MANDVYQLNIVGVAENQFWESVLHFESGVASTSTPLTTAEHLKAAFVTNVQPKLVDCMGDDALITGYKAKRVNNTGGPQLLAPVTPVSGSFGANCSVSSISGVILSYYTQGGHTRSGRWFLPALPNTAYEDGAFTSPFTDNVALLITALTATLTSSGDSFHFGVWAAKTTTFFQPSLTKLSGHLGTQRRRLHPVM